MHVNKKIVFDFPVLNIDCFTYFVYRGVATIDIELTNIDINQCDHEASSFSALDVFRGTHRCPQTTKVWSWEVF